MRYFELRDDMHIPHRWHLGEVMTNSKIPPRLRAGLPFQGSLSLEVTHDGCPLNFSLTSFAVPVSTAELGMAIGTIAGNDLQRLSVHIENYQGFEILNSIRTVRCLDEARAEFVKWTEKDHRADLAGNYRMVTKLRINPVLVPEDGHFFRVEGWLIALIVSERIKQTMEEIGCLGATFQEIA